MQSMDALRILKKNNFDTFKSGHRNNVFQQTGLDKETCEYAIATVDEKRVETVVVYDKDHSPITVQYSDGTLIRAYVGAGAESQDTFVTDIVAKKILRRVKALYAEATA